MDGILSNKANWRIIVPCAALGVTSFWLSQKVMFYFKHKGKTLPPVYSSGIQLPFLGAALQFLSDPLKMAFRGQSTAARICLPLRLLIWG